MTYCTVLYLSCLFLYHTCYRLLVNLGRWWTDASSPQHASVQIWISLRWKVEEAGGTRGIEDEDTVYWHVLTCADMTTHHHSTRWGIPVVYSPETPKLVAAELSEGQILQSSRAVRCSSLFNRGSFCWFRFSRRLTRQKDLCFILRNGLWVSEATSRHRPSCEFHLRTAMGPFAPQLGSFQLFEVMRLMWGESSCEYQIRCFFCQAGVQGFTLASCAAKSCSQNLKKPWRLPWNADPYLALPPKNL